MSSSLYAMCAIPFIIALLRLDYLTRLPHVCRLKGNLLICSFNSCIGFIPGLPLALGVASLPDFSRLTSCVPLRATKWFQIEFI